MNSLLNSAQPPARDDSDPPEPPPTCCECRRYADTAKHCHALHIYADPLLEPACGGQRFEPKGPAATTPRQEGAPC